MVIPFITFTLMKEVQILGVDIILEQPDYDRIIFWVSAFGLLISACAFFNYSSPKQSIRKGTISLIQIILNCFYLWSYKFSGALEIQITIVDLGMIEVNLQQLILTYMGIYFLTVILKTYDLVDFIINREKIKFERGK